MATVIAGMTMSLDGFVADPSGSVGPLYDDLAELRGSAYMNATIAKTCAVLMTRHPPAIPPKQDERLTFTFVNDGVGSAIVRDI